MRTAKSPYLSSSSRLADVIAALQATATYRFYQLPIIGEGSWAYRIAGNQHEARSNDVKDVFEQHPEFFRIDSQGNGTLVWRRQHQKLFDVDKGAQIPRAEYERLTSTEKQRVSRTPLESDQIATLINAAIELHTRAVAQEAARQWWITPVASVVSAFGGALLGGWLA
jgi:hypothetical protein